MQRKIVQGAALLTMSLLLTGLALYALNGRFVRYWADDYAYSLVMRDGLVEGTKNWYALNGARLSSFWFVGVIDWFGMNAVRWLPGLTILFWIASIGHFLSSLYQYFQKNVHWIWIGLTSVMLVFFSVLLMPTRLETLYWRMATLHYTLPIALTLINLSLVLRYTMSNNKGPGKAFAGLGVFIWAIVTGAHGEASGAFQVGVYLAALTLVWLFGLRDRRKQAVFFFTCAILGSLAAILVMSLSPANQWRMEAMPPPENLGDFIFYTLRYSIDFIFDSVKTQPLPNAVFLLGAMAVGLATINSDSGEPILRRGGFGLVITAGITFGLIVFTVAPSVYAGTNYPAPRALMPARFALLVGLWISGLIISLILKRIFKRFSPAQWVWVAAIGLIIVSAYGVRSYEVPLAERTDLAARADLWDKQDVEIRAAIASGKTDVIVKQVDVVDSLESLTDEPDNWLNRTVSAWYGINSITAIP